jgi:hypothetical protein
MLGGMAERRGHHRPGLRTGGDAMSNAPPSAADLLRLHRAARAWVGDPNDPAPTRNSLPYVDLTFAFGLARLGEASAARETAQRAADALAAKGDAVHDILLTAYRYRIDQALAGRPHAVSQCVGVSGRSALGTSACARMSR